MTAIPPLHQAISDRDLAGARAALERDAAQASEPLPGGLSPLLFALYNGAPEIAALLREFRELDLFEAAALDDGPMVAQRLLAQPASVHAYSPDGWTALHLAAFMGAQNALFVLLGLGAPLNATAQNPTANTPLHAAIAGAAGERIAPLLIALGADALALGGEQITTLHLAAARGYEPLCRLLLARGVVRGARSRDGHTAADLARERGHAALAAWLDGSTN